MKFEQHKCLLTKQSSSESPGTESSLLQGITVEKVDEQKWVFFSCFFLLFSLHSKKSVYFLIGNLVEDLPKRAQPHTLLVESFPEDGEVIDLSSTASDWPGQQPT